MKGMVKEYYKNYKSEKTDVNTSELKSLMQSEFTFPIVNIHYVNCPGHSSVFQSSRTIEAMDAVHHYNPTAARQRADC